MSYIRAEEILPEDVLKTVQQYVDGQAIYVPRKNKRRWGEGTDTRQTLKCRNQEIFRKYTEGSSVRVLSEEFFLTEKSIQRIIRSIQLMSDKSETDRL